MSNKNAVSTELAKLYREVAGYTADIQMGVIQLVDTKADELKEAIKSGTCWQKKNIADRSK